VWHTPLVVFPGYYANTTFDPDLSWWLPLIVFDTLLFVWIYTSTNRSILPVLVFHGMMNLTGELLGISATVSRSDEAVESPRLLSDHPLLARHVLDLVGSLPSPAWGRDELGTGEMWNSNSVISWLLTRSGMPMHAISPPAGGRAPGWQAGIITARRHQLEERAGLGAPDAPPARGMTDLASRHRRLRQPARRGPSPHQRRPFTRPGRSRSSAWIAASMWGWSPSPTWPPRSHDTRAALGICRASVALPRRGRRGRDRSASAR
jgi:hypothetical protein